MPAQTDHPTFHEIKVFLEGSSLQKAVVDNTRVVRHLLSGCSICRHRLEVLDPDGARRGQLGVRRSFEASTPRSASGNSYDQAFANAERTLSLFLSDGNPVEGPPGELLAELVLLDGDADEPARPGPFAKRSAIPQLIRWLIGRSHSVRFEDPEKMLHWGLLARLAAEACNRQVAGSPYRLADLRAQAWGQFGNSLRVCGQLDKAEEALMVAARHLQSGTGDPEVRVTLLQQTTALHLYRRAFESANATAVEAEEHCREIGDQPGIAYALFQRALAVFWGGESERAIPLIRRVLPLTDPAVDPYLVIAARHGLADCYIELKRPHEAHQLFLQTKLAVRGWEKPMIGLRMSWVEGKLLCMLGHFDASEKALRRARQGFLDRRLVHEVVAISRDLAQIYVDLGWTEKLEKIVSETGTVIGAMHRTPEAEALLAQLGRMTAH
ncbi:MAG TPA: hypothetical protein VFE33_27035 [Thermoanaerobaculia bacterium]|nr:hypothetical protein [Thermoanaerobaculia bacterium]